MSTSKTMSDFILHYESQEGKYDSECFCDDIKDWNKKTIMWIDQIHSSSKPKKLNTQWFHSFDTILSLFFDVLLRPKSY